MDFKTAVRELTNCAEITEKSTVAGQKKKIASPERESNFNFTDIAISPDMRRVTQYLSGERGISTALILDLISRRQLFQEDKTGNIIFPIYDGGAIVGAEVAGTVPQKRFKGIKTGSKYGHGYNLLFGNETAFLLFFESAIDLISFVDIGKMRGKTLNNCRFVSLMGLKENVVEREIQAANGAARAFLCVDNDTAGAKFIQDVTAKNAAIKPYLPDKAYKDWNEQLQAIRNTQIEN